MKAALLLVLLFLMPRCVGLSLLKLCGSLCLFLLLVFSVSVKMTSSVFSILLVSLVFCISVVDPTGVKIRITNQALDTLRNQAQAIVQERLVNQPFEQFQISVCTIDRLTITELTVHQAELRFRQNSGFQFVMQNFEARFSFDHQLDLGVYQHAGAKDFVAQGISANIELSLIQTQQGRLAVAMPTCEASIEQMTIIPGRLLNLLTGCLRYLFNFLFCPLVQRFAIPHVNQMLETIPTRAEVFPDFGISIDYSLTRDFQVTDNSLDVSFSGLVFREGENIPAVDPAVEPVFTQDNLMAYVGVSEFVLNSAAVSFYNAGVLGKNFETITSKPVKSYLRFRQFFQQPWRMKAPLAAAVELTEPPRISITQQQGVTVNLRVRVSAASVPENKEPKVISSVSATCEVSMMVTIQGAAVGNRLFLPYNNLRCNIVTSSQLKRRLVVPLEELLNNKASDFLEGWFRDGVELPLPHGLIFTDPLLEYQDGFVVVGGNLDLTPAGRQRVLNGDNAGR